MAETCSWRLVQEPEILLLDEPTSHLDIGHSSRHMIMNILCGSNKERHLANILISHDINIAARYSIGMIPTEGISCFEKHLKRMEDASFPGRTVFFRKLPFFSYKYSANYFLLFTN